MPQFSGQNKKRIDPRYFSEELLEEQVGRDWPIVGADKPCPAGHVALSAKAAAKIRTGTLGKICRPPMSAAAKKAVRAAFAEDPKKRCQKAGGEWSVWEKKCINLPQVRGITGAPKKTKKASRPAPSASGPRRSRGKVFAKGPEVGEIQKLLLTAFGVGGGGRKAASKRRAAPRAAPRRGTTSQEDISALRVSEARSLAAPRGARSVLGGRGRIDKKLGKTTLKSLQKLSAVKDLADPEKLKDPATVTKILNTLKQCAAKGFRPEQCRPRGESPTAVMSAPKAAAYNNCMQQCKVKLPGYQCAAKCKGTKAAPGAKAAEKKRPPMAPKAAYSDCMQRCKIKLPGYMCAPKCKAAHPGA